MPPLGKADLILDTDTFNEIDDQFALAYLLNSGDRLNIKAITAAPFFNEKVSSPADGMEKSFLEIHKILNLAARLDMVDKVYKGSCYFLKDEKTPVDSPAARVIIESSKDYTNENPLYIVAIGAITNVASALLIDPSIEDKIVVVWLGGNGFHMPDTYEFNMRQDVAAARVLFESSVKLVLLPCGGVVDRCQTTEFELKHWLQGKNVLADYLIQNTVQEAEKYAKERPWSRVIWDISAVAWMLNDDGRYMQGRKEQCPFVEYDYHYSNNPNGKMIHYVYTVDRDAIFEDMFKKISKMKS